MTGTKPRVAIFRPRGRREDESVELLRSSGFEVLSDPLLEPRPTDEQPLGDADFVVFTSVTGARIALEGSYEPRGETVCAIGPKTRSALEEGGVEVDVVPEEYSSEGLVEALKDEVRGKKVEVARSDHGSSELIDGLNESGAFVHETVLYELVRPEGGGEEAVEGILKGRVDGVLFTSSLTVENLLSAAGEGRSDVVEKLCSVVVGAIGEPTRETAVSCGVDVDFTAESETFESLVEGLERELETED
ncbi:MAG: uroporphyrinogen-III synthase [Halobacteria archaeon]|nr:uroporphyrinogen-III synthase [Halobacteria archaeon]